MQEELTSLQKTILDSLGSRWKIIDAAVLHRASLDLVRLGLAVQNCEDPRKFRKTKFQ